MTSIPKSNIIKKICISNLTLESIKGMKVKGIVAIAQGCPNITVTRDTSNTAIM